MYLKNESGLTQMIAMKKKTFVKYGLIVISTRRLVQSESKACPTCQDWKQVKIQHSMPLGY